MKKTKDASPAPLLAGWSRFGLIKGIIWDLDGVLIDSLPNHIKSEVELFKTYGVELTPEVAQEYTGYSLEDYLKAMIARFNIKAPLEELLAKHKKTQEHNYSNAFPLAPHAVDVLRSLKGIYRMGLATSTLRDFAESVLKRFLLTDYFSAVTCGGEVKHGKPDPEIFIVTAEKLNISPEKILVVEDSISAIKGAKSAGMRTAFKRTDESRNQFVADFADFVIEDLSEIPARIGNLV